MNTAHPRLELVDHREIFGDQGRLPSFNSHAIGARLHHIPGLAEHYMHFNDDFFLGRPVSPELFFQGNGVSKFFLSRSTLDLADPGLNLPHEQARRNVVDLLQNEFGRSPTRVFFHTPITQRRSTMFELEDRYPDVFRQTWNSQFRDHADFEINSWLHHFYGYLRGYAAPGRIAYDYFSLDKSAARRRMVRMRHRRTMDAFCINDSIEVHEEHHVWARSWLNRYYPNPSTFERA